MKKLQTYELTITHADNPESNREMVITTGEGDWWPFEWMRGMAVWAEQRNDYFKLDMVFGLIRYEVRQGDGS